MMIYAVLVVHSAYGAYRVVVYITRLHLTMSIDGYYFFLVSNVAVLRRVRFLCSLIYYISSVWYGTAYGLF